MEENLPELNSSSPRFSRKQILSTVVLVILLISIPIGVYLVQHTQIFKPKAAEKKGNYLVNKERPKPEYAAGEIIFKLKPKTPKLEVKQEKMAAGLNLDKQAVSFDDLDENTIPQILKEIHQKYKIKQIEKVFKGTEEPEKELNKFKNRFAKEIQEGRRKINEKEFLNKDLTRVYKITLENDNFTETVIQNLSLNPRVAYAELNYKLKTSIIPNDPDFSKLWGLHNTGQTGGTADADIDAPEAWDTTTGDSNMVVGVIDTGIDYNHVDLKDNIWTNPGEIPGNGIDDDNNGYIDDLHGYDWVNNDSDPMDDNNHGTHVSGTIGAVANNSIGVVGVSWNVKLMALKFLSAGGSGYTDDAVKAVEYANKMGVKITSNSWGGGSYSQPLFDIIDQAASLNALFIAAAGNGATDTDSHPNYPSSYNLPNIIAVSASDHNDKLASFSNYGLISVDVAAPGVDILSTTPNNSYQTFSGTSMATPHVAGLVALVWAKNPSLLNLEVKSQIEHNSDDLGEPGRDKYFSAGRINAQKTVESKEIFPIAEITQPENGSLIGGMVQVAGTAAGSTFSFYKIELGEGQNPSVWTNQGISLINNGTGPVFEGTLGTIDSSVYHKGTWTIKLSVVSSSGLTSERKVAVDTDPDIRSGWPKSLRVSSGGVLDKSYFLADDLNGDSQKEIIAVAPDGTIYVWSNNGELLPGWPKYLGGSIDGQGYTTPAVADLNRDGKKEIALVVYRFDCMTGCFESYDLHLLNIDGQEVNSSWPKAGSFSQSLYYNDPIIEDINGDGSLEVLSFNNLDNKLHIFSYDGLERYISLSKGGSKFLSVGDLNGDKKKELVFAKENEILAYSDNGTLLWVKNIEFPAMFGTVVSWAKPTLADINRDGKLEIIVASGSSGSSTDGKVWVITYDGKDLLGWPQSAWTNQGNIVRATVSVGDLNKDGLFELVWGTDWGRVLIFNEDGTVNNILYDGVYSSSNFNRGSALADIDSDLFPDIVLGSPQMMYDMGAFFAWNYSGSLLTGWPKNVLISSTPQITDIDNNGQVDIIAYGKESFSAEDKIFIWSLGSKYSKEYTDWSVYGVNEKRTSNWVFPRTLPTPTPSPIPTLPPPPHAYPELPKSLNKAAVIPNQSYIEVPVTSDNPSLNISGPMTIEAWINFKGSLPNEQKDILLKKSASKYDENDSIYLLRYNAHGPSWGDPTIGFWKTDLLTTQMYHGWTNNPQITSNNWYHLASVYDGSSTKIYINGILLPFYDSGSQEGGIFTDLLKPLRIGEGDNRNSQLLIDELRISDIARDISLAWNNNLYFNPLEADSNTIALWHYDDNLIDSSSHHNDGVAQGKISYLPGSEAVSQKKACLQVITPAKNPATGECKTYPTSCIPEGWVKVSSCTIQ